ncbi:MAG: hypothetical protein EXS43_09410 [Opitutus sp.]|nr:hypothetical protein [Opitutus sp.]
MTNSTGTGSLYARSFTNDGTIAATGGTLNLGTSAASYVFANDPGGNITVSGASTNLQLNAPNGTYIVNQGTFSVPSGTLYTNGLLNNSTGGTLKGAGTINGSVLVSGGTIAPGNAGIGTFSFVTGALNVTNSAVFEVDLGGSTADKLSFQNPPAAINLGAGLLALSVNLLSAPTPGSTDSLLQITAGGGGITGWFSGLPNSGDIYTTVFNSTSYYFSVNYQANLVSLSVVAVPEPPAYVLLVALASILPILRRRWKR